MWILKIILEFITYPIRVFWERYQQYKEEKSVWKVVALFAGTFMVFLLVAFALLYLVAYVVTYHFEIIVIIGFVIGLYMYVKFKMDERQKIVVAKEQEQDAELAELQKQAEKGYRKMANIIYQTLKTFAENIGGIAPRVFAEIEIPDCHFTLVRGICFYQFRLAKSDIRTRYTMSDLAEFKEMLQAEIGRKIQAGDFPTLAVENYIGADGNVHEAVKIDVIEDVDSQFIIQAVFYSPQYAKYLKRKQEEQRVLSAHTTVPNASWDK